MPRPNFSVALAFWLVLLRERGCASSIIWAFREDLCLEKLGHSPGGNWEISFSTIEDPLAMANLQRIYTNCPPGALVFDTLLQEPDFTLCALLGDPYVRDEDTFKPEWDLYFNRRDPYQLVERVTDPISWQARKQDEWERISPLDFVFFSHDWP